MTREAILLLEENSKDTYLEITDILLKIIDNVLNSPGNLKFRKLRLSNPIICNKLLPNVGAMECLFAMGFQEDVDSLCLPVSAPLSILHEMKEEINNRRKRYTNRKLQDITFLDQITDLSESVLSYENKELQKLALSKLPYNLKEKYDNQFDLLMELMAWFKCDFFTWVDKPECSDCETSVCTFIGHSTNVEEMQFTTRVEVYTCGNCGKRLLFPRYNDPALLLRSRKGRCGEWANCFTLFCRALGLKARFVLDKTDHVWTEVYSEEEKRWVHCDPCEVSLDAPLMYEMGWNKKLSYVIAFSNEEVQDVTWRYTCNFDETKSRRTLCTERQLLSHILELSRKRQLNLSKEERDSIALRRAMECLELLTPPVANAQYCGRTSGSLSWRLQRGECKTKHTWVINKEEIQNKRFVLKYCTSSDTYIREENDIKSGWNNGVYESENIFRKVEYDWKVCYLCRDENSEKGTITWKFELENQGQFDNVKITYNTDTYFNGKVEWSITSGDLLIPHKSEGTCIEADLENHTNFSITAKLSGGSGKEHWQHAQLFRQPLNSKEYLFHVVIKLK